MSKAWIPNFITLLNLLFGCCAILCVLNRDYYSTFWFLFGAGWFDFADGLVARALKVSSEHGKELDSLADMVSFGVVPAFIYYSLLVEAFAPAIIPLSGAAGATAPIPFLPAALPALILAMFSALRLAKFNLDVRQTENFIGVATPTSTVYAAGLMLIFANDSFGWGAYVASPWVLYPSIAAMCYLLVSEHPMFSFKLKGLYWKGNETRIIFALLAVGLLVFLREAAFPFIVGVYLITNLLAPPMEKAPKTPR